jgi:hypothetical protein
MEIGRQSTAVGRDRNGQHTHTHTHTLIHTHTHSHNHTHIAVPEKARKDATRNGEKRRVLVRAARVTVEVREPNIYARWVVR